MSGLQKVRRIAALLLIACFFLPLSRCASTGSDGAGSDDYRFPYEHLTAAVADIGDAGRVASETLPLAVVTLLVFFAPLAVLMLRPLAQALSLLALGVPAEWLLYYWTTIGDPQIGGVLAMTCWAALMLSGGVGLWREWTARLRRPSQASA